MHSFIHLASALILLVPSLINANFLDAREMNRDLGTYASSRSQKYMRRVRASSQEGIKARSNRGPKRLKRVTEATLKCLTAYIFALCDGDRCTNMGSVAAGTKCVNGAITWDDAYSSSDSEATTATTSTTVASVAETTTIAAPANLAVKNDVKTQSATTTAAASSPSASSSSSSSNSDDAVDSDDESCESDDTETDAVAITTAPSTTTTSYSAAAAATTTTTKAAVTTVTAAASAVTTANLNVQSGNWITGGRGTFFYQYGAYGACGKIHADSDYIIAISLDRYGTGSNNAPDCGKTVEIINNANGKSVVATVADACPGCAYNSLDLSTGAFNQIGEEATGVLDIKWKYLS